MAETVLWGPETISSSRRTPSAIRPGSKRAATGQVEPREGRTREGGKPEEASGQRLASTNEPEPGVTPFASAAEKEKHLLVGRWLRFRSNDGFYSPGTGVPCWLTVPSWSSSWFFLLCFTSKYKSSTEKIHQENITTSKVKRQMTNWITVFTAQVMDIVNSIPNI